MKKLLATFLILTAVFVPIYALASHGVSHEENGDSTALPNPLTVGSFEELLLRIRDILLIFALPLFALMVAVSGIVFIISGGNPAKRQQALNILKFAIIGFIVIVLATAIVAFVTGIFAS